MRRAKSGLVIAIAMIFAGCSPYVYKTEITGFAVGVNDLAAAYATGRKSVAEDRTDKTFVDQAKIVRDAFAGGSTA